MKSEIEEKVRLLEEKYAAMGQNLESYLDGLLYADYLTYWDYIHLDTLLSLQNPRTPFKDESIFIMYHQITELYFKLSLHELHQIADEEVQYDKLLMRIVRINRYFEALTKSFEIMVQGMELEQFLKFRMSLLPASGFQSAQYRMIEICATPLYNLVEHQERHRFDKNSSPQDVEAMMEFIYWKKGATELATGKKTLTLEQFEAKYLDSFIHLAKKRIHTNLWSKYKQLSTAEQAEHRIITALRQLDYDVNVNWPLQHYKSAARYLHKNPEDIAATGGTNWQKYLPPRFQRRVFYPELWTNDELASWGSQTINP